MPQSTQCQPLYDRIVNHLIINAGFMKNIGLYHGKMGILLFFAHYARYTSKDIYEKYAGDLMDDIHEKISDQTPWDFENGLAGIGWGIHYLLKNRFMEGDPEDVLEVIDYKMMEINLPNLQNMSLPNGLQGICCYLQHRLKGVVDENKIKLPFDKRYRDDYVSVRSRFKPLNDREVFLSVIGALPSGDSITDWPLGLTGGCAGWSMSKLINDDPTILSNKSIL